MPGAQVQRDDEYLSVQIPVPNPQKVTYISAIKGMFHSNRNISSPDQVIRSAVLAVRGSLSQGPKLEPRKRGQYRMGRTDNLSPLNRLNQ